ncbi:hypothetical protein BF93_00850 [Brachybacterium phenoliresistens]|uniref:Uncharacterized protein n=1 Tax=Brachybacterium phenoliresistens TaxID=396014 RepID=Z9JRW6_9MICO|nr:hypothetical protein BF93_00850 [Brachybacterium phenoliresistens]
MTGVMTPAAPPMPCVMAVMTPGAGGRRDRTLASRTWIPPPAPPRRPRPAPRPPTTPARRAPNGPGMALTRGPAPAAPRPGSRSPGGVCSCGRSRRSRSCWAPTSPPRRR